MKKLKPFLLLLGIFSYLILTKFNIAYSESINIKWLEPIFIHDSSYQVEEFIPKKDGFQIYIARNKIKTFWHIQVRSDNNIELSEKRYIIKFKGRSNKDFTLYSRLGEDNVNDGNSYVDRQWHIIGDGIWHTYNLEFIGKNIANYLYFQLGKAPAGTRFEVSDISIDPL